MERRGIWGKLIMNGRGCKAKLRKITQIYPRSPKFRQNKAKLVTIVGGKKRRVGESDNEWERMRGSSWARSHSQPTTHSTSFTHSLFLKRGAKVLKLNFRFEYMLNLSTLPIKLVTAAVVFPTHIFVRNIKCLE